MFAIWPGFDDLLEPDRSSVPTIGNVTPPFSPWNDST